MTDARTEKKLRELETLLAGLAGTYGLKNYERERQGKRKSPVDQAKYEAYGYAADQIKKLLEEEN
ncbi:MAG: hypothetical protein IIY54_10555 [Ruminococcus sp.]|nr:hypothetical protein [Ruminococcus sp.]MBQ1310138.1 hypothetical protein [Ruminococcus sp.]